MGRWEGGSRRSNSVVCGTIASAVLKNHTHMRKHTHAKTHARLPSTFNDPAGCGAVRIPAVSGERGDCDPAQTWSVRCCSFLRRATTSCSSVSTLLLLQVAKRINVDGAWVTRHSPALTDTERHRGKIQRRQPSVGQPERRGTIPSL